MISGLPEVSVDEDAEDARRERIEDVVLDIED